MRNEALAGVCPPAVGKAAPARILLVEDRPELGALARLRLTAGGHEVMGPAATEAEALRLVAAARPDLALVDIELADGDDGVALARRLTRTWGIPCLFVTGSLAAARAAPDAALGVLAKPYTGAALLASVTAMRALLQGAAPGPLPLGLDLFRRTCPAA